MEGPLSEIEKLSNREAITAVKSLVAHWAEARGLEALVAWQAINQAAGGEQLPSPLVSSKDEDRATAVICRRILAVVVDGDAPDARRWAAGAIAAAKQPKAQIFDPVSLTILGATAIGLVLAARVKRIGSAEFYKGLPKGADKLVRAGVSAISGVPPTGD
jgi:hypothetical protein